MSNKEDYDGPKREFRPLPMDEETKRRLWANVKEQNPTPNHVLETQLRDPRIPKDEIVHYAARRIAELEAENERLKLHSEEIRADADEALHTDGKRIAELQAENERLRRPACGTEQVWLDTIRHDDEQALLWFRAMQRESDLKKKAMEDAERLAALEAAIKGE